MTAFKELSPMDFEELVADLISAEEGMRFRTGVGGRDGGIDAVATLGDERHVIQCKHYRRSTFPQLKAAAREEVNKLVRLTESFASYRFVTSMPLSHTQRERLAETLGSWIDSSDDVLGGNDVEALLRKHPEIERSHPKLWLASAGTMRRLLSAAAYERSRALLEEVHRRLPLYLKTEAFFEARHRMHEKFVCILSGPPGVGKTTLARLLLLEAIDEGFQPVEIVPGSLRDAWELLGVGEKRFFYIDDVFGRTALLESREQDRDLMRFIKAVAAGKRARLVITTRDYILRQANLMSETVTEESDGAYQYLLSPERYTRRERARILHNHVYFSPQVDAMARKSLVSDHNYLRVIDHRSYSPRLVEWITGWLGHDLTEDEKSSFGTYCLETLDSPDWLWEHPFEHGLDDHGRALLLTLCIGLERVDEEQLERAFDASCASRGLPTAGRRFQRTLSALDGSFLQSTERNGRLAFSLINPSLLDYLKRYVTGRADAGVALMGACYFDQVKWLWHALTERGGLPPRSLWVAFDAAFSRTVDVPFAGDERRSSLYNRLDFLLDIWGADPWFAEVFAAWLPDSVRRWLEEIASRWFLTEGELKLALRLIEHGLLDPSSIGGKVRRSVERVTPYLDRWDLFDAFSRLLPEEVLIGELRERYMLEGYIRSVLEDPDGPLSDDLTSANLDRLEALAESWGASVDDESLEVARRSVDRREREIPKPLGKRTGRTSWSYGARDAVIEAMFERLIED